MRVPPSQRYNRREREGERERDRERGRENWANGAAVCGSQQIAAAERLGFGAGDLALGIWREFQSAANEALLWRRLTGGAAGGGGGGGGGAW